MCDESLAENVVCALHEQTDCGYWSEDTHRHQQPERELAADQQGGPLAAVRHDDSLQETLVGRIPEPERRAVGAGCRGLEGAAAIGHPIREEMVLSIVDPGPADHDPQQ